jgi:uncharacterized protein YegP (UPF0339 family)
MERTWTKLRSVTSGGIVIVRCLQSVRDCRERRSDSTVFGGDEVVAKRVVYERSDGTWAWRLVADNGDIIAVDGSQGYENKTDARSMADKIINGTHKDTDKSSNPIS